MSTFGEQLEPPGQTPTRRLGRSSRRSRLQVERWPGLVHVRSAAATGGADQLDCHSGYGGAWHRPLHEFPKPLTDEVAWAADAVITMGCGDACPIYPGKVRGPGGPLPGREEP